MMWFLSVWMLPFTETIYPRCTNTFILSSLSLLNRRNSSDPESQWPEATCQSWTKTRGKWRASLRPCKRPGRSAAGRGTRTSSRRGRINTSRRESGVAGSSRSKTDNRTNLWPWPAWHDEAWRSDKAASLSENSLSSIHHTVFYKINQLMMIISCNIHLWFVFDLKRWSFLKRLQF